MPIHDWTKIFAGAFHDFHHSWITELRNALNGGLLPRGYYAQGEQTAGQILRQRGAARGDGDHIDFRRRHARAWAGRRRIAAARAATREESKEKQDRDGKPGGVHGKFFL